MKQENVRRQQEEELKRQEARKKFNENDLLQNFLTTNVAAPSPSIIQN